MDDLYAINAAKTDFRECFNFSDVSRLLAIADPEMVNFSDGMPWGIGRGGLDDLKFRLEKLFEQFNVQLAVIVIEIRIEGNAAYDYGWHEFTFTPKEGGEVVRRRDRYVDIWRKNEAGEWKLWMYMDNRDVADTFQPEEAPPLPDRIRDTAA
ncbi:MAG TPA: nuclear transport factor 2 family protein [Verrucomicrobiae bacterium]|nr:nuclear transport factor 2 family protein [Verrucomicrobiae bacterium]